jgi:hypothetical protein
MISMSVESGTELNRDFLKNKEREEWKRLNKQFGVNGGGLKKRDNKAGDKEREKEDKKQEQMERQSVASTMKSKLSNRAILKEVVESNWEFLGKDEKRNKCYKCLLCKKEKVRSDNRRTHKCSN